jgi:dTDP-glucose 4,6-dehydratase
MVFKARKENILVCCMFRLTRFMVLCALLIRPSMKQHLMPPTAHNLPSAAASDHLITTYHYTYRLSTLSTKCSNNYGHRQFPGKLIPLMRLNALTCKRLLLYGDDLDVRDWLYVKDHCEALRLVLERGRPREV